MQAIAMFALASMAVGGVVYVFVYPFLSGEKKAEARMASVAKAEPVARKSRNQQKSRRDTVESTLKELEDRHKKQTRVPLAVKITQAGLTWSKNRYLITSGDHRSRPFFRSSSSQILASCRRSRSALPAPLARRDGC